MLWSDAIQKKVKLLRYGFKCFCIGKESETTDSYQKILLLWIGPALSTRGNLACARARGAGSPRTVEHHYLPGLGCYETLLIMAKEYGEGGEDTDGDRRRQEADRHRWELSVLRYQTWPVPAPAPVARGHHGPSNTATCPVQGATRP